MEVVVEILSIDSRWASLSLDLYFDLLMFIVEKSFSQKWSDWTFWKALGRMVVILSCSFSMAAAYSSPLNAVPSSTRDLHAGKRFCAESWVFPQSQLCGECFYTVIAAVVSWPGPWSFRVMSTRNTRSITQSCNLCISPQHTWHLHISSLCCIMPVSV